MLGKEILDFAREDVLAAGDDHLVVTTLHEQPPLIVDSADVSCRHVLAEHLLATAARVAAHLQFVDDENPSGLAPRHLIARLIDEADGRTARRTSRRTWGRA